MNHFKKLEETYSQIKALTLEQIDDQRSKKYSPYENWLHLCAYAIFDYTDALFSLRQTNNHRICDYVLRGLVEFYINKEYFSHDELGTSRIRDEMINGYLKQKKKMLMSLKEMVTKYPHHAESLNKLGNKIDFGKIEESLKQEEREIKTTFNGKPINTLNLKDRAIKNDFSRDPKVNKKETGHFIFNYEIPYRLTSGIVHINLNGLGNFIETNDKNRIIKKNKMDHASFYTGLGIWVSYIKDLIDYEIISGEILSLIEEFESLISK